MQKIMKRSLALLLAVVLCLSAMPLSAFATEITEPLSSEALSSESPAESSLPEDEADSTPTPEPADEPVEQPDDSPAPQSQEGSGGGSDPYETEGASIDATKVWPTAVRRMAAARASVGASSVLKIGYYCFDEEVGYLPTLGLEIHNLPAKTMLSGGTHIAAYCLDSHLGATDGENYTWSSLSKNNQETVGTILALGFQWSSSDIWSGPSDNADKWAVTQILVWEAVANNIFLQANGLYGVKSGVDTDINKAAAYAYNPSGFKAYYESIKTKLTNYLKIPSFASKSASSCETITMKWDGTNYSATVTDTNGVLNNFDFSASVPGVSISASGNTLTLSSAQAITNPKTSSRVDNDDGVAAGAGAVAVWRTSDSSQQDFATYNAAGADPVGCYIKVDTEAVGDASLTKTAEDGKVSGIQFEIAGSDGSSRTVTTDANGNIDVTALPIYMADGSKITYTATEINVPNRYVKPGSQTFQLSEGQTASIQFENKLKRWRVTVTKTDSRTGSTPQGNGTLAGAKYGVYQGGTLVDEYTTDANGQIITNYYPYGEDWTLREISASEGYTVSTASTKLCNIPAGTNDEYNDNTATVNEDIIRGGISVEKRDSQTGSTPQGDADFADIQFEIINDSRNPVEVNGHIVAPGSVAATITTNSSGFATTGANALPYGDYIVREKSTNTSMLKTFTEEIKVSVSENGKVYAFTAENDVVRGGISIQKHDSQTGAVPQGNADFAGISFEIINKSAKPVVVDGRTVAPNEVVLTITTDENGYASTADDALPFGRYTVREKDTNKSMLLTWKEQQVTVSENRKTYSVTAVDDVVRGGLAVEKRDTITGSTPQGDADFEGITFEVINNSKNPVIVNGRSIAPGEVALTLTTDANGECSTSNNALPYGEYVLHEKSTNTSMLNTAEDQVVVVDEHHKVYTHYMDNEVVRGGVLIEKRDLESKLLTPLGGASLDGTLFEITNKSKRAVYVNGALYEPDEVCVTIEVKDGIAQSDVRALPYGTYTLAESKPGKGYLWTDKTVRDFTVRADGEISEFREGDAAYNQVIRGELKFQKVGEKNMHRFGNVAFKLTSQTTGESHILVTDSNGEVRTETAWNPHTQNTNGNDDKPEAEWDDLTGTWFGLTTEGQMVETQDGLCSLPFDKYILQELRCAGNEGYELVTVPDITISRNTAVIELGTIDDHEDGKPRLGTTASVDGEKTAEPASEITLVDVVSYSSLDVGKTYKLSGILMDKETGEPLEIDGQQITAEKEFTPENASGTEELSYTFNASALAGKSVVVFEDLYIGEKKTASHADIEDEGQTVTFTEVKIGTTATVDGEHTAEPVGEITLIDTVAYSGLMVGKEYTVKGVLMDKATGEPLLVDGQEVTAEASFIASQSEGSIDIPYIFEGSALSGKTVVAFETLYRNGLEVAVHADIEDEDQTVTFGDKPEVKTTATANGEKTAEPVGEITIVDTVSYTKLTVGESYKLTGILMDKATNQPLLVDGEEVTAEAEFTAETEDGSIDVEFTFDASALAGKSVVVFESLYHDDIEVAAHADITDEGQTVEFEKPDEPKIKTEATVDGEKESDPLDEVTIIDTVTYSGLTPGKTYTIKGVLMDKATGNKLLVDDKEITSENSFTPDTAEGTVEMMFTFSASGLAGKSVVVFESLYHEGIEVAVHADINDKNQTITFRAKGGLLIKKTAEDNFVEGISFLVTGKDFSKTFKTGKNGEIRVDGLTPGEYTVTEISDKATARYEVQEGKTVTVTADGKTAEVKFYNKLLRGQIIGRKTDTEGNPLEGVTFGLFANDAREFTADKAVATAKTNVNGKFVFDKVAYGEWQIKELEALPGYVILADSIKVTVNSSKVTLEDIQNEHTQIVISKVDSSTGRELPGAKLEILDKNGKVIESWTTTDKPHTIAKLPVGEYTLHEVSAPKGYELAEDIKFTVKDTSEAITIVMQDKPTDTVDTPQTGDYGWKMALAVFGVSLGGVIISLFISRKKKKEID